MEQDIATRLATRLKEARSAKGLSLEAVAKLSGVSRSMVSQIERGESSPTVATLWNLTQALQVDFAGLLEGRVEPAIRIVRVAAAPVIEDRERAVHIRILSAPHAVGDHEIYEIRFEPGAALDSAPHRAGCREDLVVLAGAVRVRSGDEEARLETGDSANYAADCPHCVTAEGGAASVMMIVRNS
ncbi:helix-turn-helix domain-containing protein [Paracoccus aurantiacus]|uniref:Helix-turn-helix domain-containing protein n=1 Tax=Paracoccus aurantiacus TaxID=2599412 RepID=A0A5C6SAX1_9RHOB|nr:XRE family transcriptional regulator [Paracoccus aurantiacus]TXB70755.1 helix-turn-helix domain-containing protein [Paracoccus aurantiacus]